MIGIVILDQTIVFEQIFSQLDKQLLYNQLIHPL